MFSFYDKLLSAVVTYRTYAKYIPYLARRESIEEIINRDMQMHLDRFPKLSRDIIKAFQQVHDFKVAPSMRRMQFAGDAIAKNNLRQYNCSFLNITEVRVFSEILYILLSGTGVGFSVQRHHINQLPKVRKPSEDSLFKVHDSIMGWAQALEMLINAYYFGGLRPIFDLSGIREKGTYMVTTGAKAPGPAPLKYMLDQVEIRLKKALGKKLTSLECHDLICIISDCVLAGGIRRSALISLFDKDDEEMLRCKQGDWWSKYPWRARANNSAVLIRSETTKEEFDYVYNMCKDSNAGEPGFFFSDNKELGTNPCCEIALNDTQLCNLTTINQTGITSKKDYLNRVYAATLIGTLQASYTDFDYLRPSWKKITEEEALLGVSYTGIADNNLSLNEDLLIEGAKLTLEVNAKYAHKIGINVAARIGCIKPEGSASCVLMSSSGIHARHSPYYIRRIRMNKDDALALYLKNIVPHLVEDDLFSSTGIVVSIPQKSPEGALVRQDETALSAMGRGLFYRKNWIEASHRYGDNKHNVSITISVRESEWEALKESMWENRYNYNGISLLPYDNSVYKQAPFEECTEQVFNSMALTVGDIDLREVREESDMTNRSESLGCAGGLCEVIL